MPIIFTSLGLGRGALEPQTFYNVVYVGPTPDQGKVFRPWQKSLPDKQVVPRMDETWTWRQVHMLGQDQVPGEQVFELAPRAPPRPYFGTEWRQVQMLGQDQVPGEQVYDLVPRAASRLPYYGTEWRQVHMLGRDVVPGEQVYDLAPRAASRLPYYGTEWRQVGMLGQDKLPVGTQVYDRQILPPWGAGQTWVLNLQTTTLAPVVAVALPYNQYDWPVPPRVIWYQDWSQNLQLTTLAPPAQAPFYQLDWPLPKVPGRIDETWTWNQLPMLGMDQLPVGEQVTDLTPKAPPRLAYYGTEWNQLRMLGQDRFPVGKQVVDLTAHRFVPFRPEQTWTWRQVGMRGQDVLLVGEQVYDLPPKPPQRLPLYSTEWRQVGMLGQDRLPENQYDWPLPNRGPYRIEQTWAWRQVGMVGLDYLLAGQQVYDRPMRAPLRAADLYTWIQSVNLALNTTPVTLPYNQYDWPLPRPTPRQAITWTWRQVDKIGRDILPRNQFDWPLPNRGPVQFTRSAEWRQVDKIGRDRLPVGQQIYDRPNRGLRLAIYDWIQSVNLALTVVPPPLPISIARHSDRLPDRGPFQPDRSFLFRSQFIPSVTPFVGAQYFLLQPHYVNDALLEAWTTVTEGHEIPIGWIPTLMVDPLNDQAVAAFYRAGPRSTYLGPGYDWQAFQGYTARRTAAIQSPITHWYEVSPNSFKLTGLGANLPARGDA